MTKVGDLGRLTVITGPSGVGKGSLVKELTRLHAEIWLSVSATTRGPRSGESDGTHYFFMKKERFEQLVQTGGFLEWAEFAGNFYGTPRDPVQKHLEESFYQCIELKDSNLSQKKPRQMEHANGLSPYMIK